MVRCNFAWFALPVQAPTPLSWPSGQQAVLHIGFAWLGSPTCTPPVLFGGVTYTLTVAPSIPMNRAEGGSGFPAQTGGPEVVLEQPRPSQQK